MHVILGLALIIVVVGGLFVILNSGVLQPAIQPFQSAFGPVTTSTTAKPSNQSDYYGQVKVHSIITGSGLDKTQVVSLVGYPKEQGVTLTGWSVRTDLKRYTIPKAQNLYSPSVQGVPPEDAYLRLGNVANFYSGKNPTKDQPQAIRSGLNEWRFWTGGDLLTAPHGTVDVYDAKGKLVDEYKY